MKLKKWEVLIIATLLLFCGALAIYFYLPRTGETVAVITVDSTVRYRIDLSERTDPYTFCIAKATGKPVSFEVKDGQIRFVEVTCPDHICERASWCHAPGNRAVCMPNRVALVCYERAELPSGGVWVTANTPP